MSSPSNLVRSSVKPSAALSMPADSLTSIALTGTSAAMLSNATMAATPSCRYNLRQLVRTAVAMYCPAVSLGSGNLARCATLSSAMLCCVMLYCSDLPNCQAMTLSAATVQIGSGAF